VGLVVVVQEPEPEVPVLPGKVTKEAIREAVIMVPVEVVLMLQPQMLPMGLARQVGVELLTQ
jgi:hypothetical protein